MNGGDREQDWDDGNDQPLETGRLALEGEKDDRLPWLEAPDDDYDDFEDGGNGRMLRLLVILAFALAVIVGGLWWFTRQGADETLVADGSTVPAPPGPYKEVPKDPGGKTFAGTGDSSFAVSEGQSRPPQLAASETPAPPSPVATPAASPSKPATTPARPAATASPVASAGVGVQVGAYSSKEAAEAGWNRLVGQSGELLSGVAHRVIAGTADNGTIYRLQAVSGSADAARALCAKLKAANIACQVK